MSGAVLSVVVSALAVCGLTPVAASSEEPTSGESGRVIVILKAPTAERAARTRAGVAQRHDLSVRARYSHVFQGFAASMPESRVDALRHDPAVAAVYRDGVLRVKDQPSTTARPVRPQRFPNGLRRIEADTYLHLDVGKVTVDGDIAILDTGVDEHRDLNLFRTIDCGRDDGCTRRGPARDGYGHGTMVAGLAAAQDNRRGVVGVAPGARIWNLRVFNESGLGRWSWAIAALDWITARADRIEVANLSFAGRGPHPAVAQAVAAATDAGIVVVAGAGNEESPATRYSPANAPGAITVSGFVDSDGKPGGLGRQCPDIAVPDFIYDDDGFLPYSNYGDAVDIAAPTECTRSTAAGGGYARFGGTSGAAPHVAGAALLWIKVHHLAPSPRRTAMVRRGLVAQWSVSQDSPCGFDAGRSDEPVLHLTRCSPTTER